MPAEFEVVAAKGRARVPKMNPAVLRPVCRSERMISRQACQSLYPGHPYQVRFGRWLYVELLRRRHWAPLATFCGIRRLGLTPFGGHRVTPDTAQHRAVL